MISTRKKDAVMANMVNSRHVFPEYFPILNVQFIFYPAERKQNSNSVKDENGDICQLCYWDIQDLLIDRLDTSDNSFRSTNRSVQHVYRWWEGDALSIAVCSVIQKAWQMSTFMIIINHIHCTSWTNVNMLIFLAHGSYSVETDTSGTSWSWCLNDNSHLLLIVIDGFRDKSRLKLHIHLYTILVYWR